MSASFRAYCLERAVLDRIVESLSPSTWDGESVRTARRGMRGEGTQSARNTHQLELLREGISVFRRTTMHSQRRISAVRLSTAMDAGDIGFERHVDLKTLARACSYSGRVAQKEYEEERAGDLCRRMLGHRLAFAEAEEDGWKLCWNPWQWRCVGFIYWG